MPTVRAYFGIGVVNKKIYAIGGYYINENTIKYLTTNEEYNPVIDR